MPTSKLIREVQALRERLDDWNYQYYVLDQPTVPAVNTLSAVKV